jgi:hypothetical protein
MKKEIAEKWVTALRSGEYKQGQTALRSIDNEFCCLGVLCDLHAKAGEGSWGPVGTGFYVYKDSNGFLPVPVMEWAGIKTIRGEFLETNLTRLNDSGVSFEKIADIIEANADKL